LGICKAMADPNVLELVRGKPAQQANKEGSSKHRLADASLERRANSMVRNDLEDHNRVYDPDKEKSWGEKYRFFSGVHMRRNYPKFAEARHDPFNKDPSWGKAVLHRVSKACKKKDVSPESLFKGLDIDGDGNLNRPELKRVLTTLLPDISNPEITAIFDMIDQDKSGEVSIPELCGALNKQGREASGPPEHANRWRNPIHRINRFPPGKIEGWDHLEGPCQTERLDRLCDRQTSEIMSRLGESLVTTPRAVQHQNKTPKYLYFGGGAGIGVDSSRFRRREWEQQRSKTGEVPKLTVPEVGTPTRPGWLCEPGSPLVSKGLVAPSVASSAR